MNETLEITRELQEQISTLEEKVNELNNEMNKKLDTLIRATFGSYSEVEEYLKQSENESK